MMENRHKGQLKTPKRVGQDGTTAAQVIQYVDRITDYESSKRCELSESWQTDNAMVAGYQWLTVQKPQSGSSRRVPKVRADLDRDGIPQPTRALTLKLHDAETAQLAKRHSEMNVEPSDASSPSSRAAAKVSKNILTYHLTGDKGIRWRNIHRKFWDQVVRYGTSPLVSRLLWDHQDTIMTPVTTAVMCGGSSGVETKQRPVVDAMGLPMLDELGMEMTEDYEEPYTKPSCGTVLSSAEVSAEHAEEVDPLGGGAHPKPGFEVATSKFDIKAGRNKNTYRAATCPCCLDGEMKPHSPTFDEAKNETDYYGRPLGKPQPLAKAVVEAPSVFGWFPENEGIGVDPWDVKVHGFLSVKSLAWIEQYYPKNAHLVEPEDATVISDIFPLAGEFDSKTSRFTGTERNLYQTHVILKEVYDATRTKEFPNGRAIIAAGKVILLDDDFYVKGENGQEDLGRIEVGVGRCFLRDGELWADGFPRHSRSPNLQINMTMAQLTDKREHSFFNVLGTSGMEMLREWGKKLAGFILRWKPDPLAPGMKPEVISTPLTDTSALEEIRYYEDSTQGDLGLNEGDIGELKGLASTPYSSYAMSKQSSGERREPRIEEGVDAIQRVLRHQLMLIQRYYREPRQFRTKAADGWEIGEFKGADISGETDVRVKEEPFFDQENATRDATAAAVEKNQLPLPTRRAQREYFKAIGVKESILDESNVQLDRAERNWMSWLRNKRVPIINPTMDDLDLHHQELGRLLYSDDGVECAERVKWDEVLDGIVEWEVELGKLQAALPGLKQMGWRPGQPVIQQVMDPMTQQPTTVSLIDQAAQQAYAQQVEQAAMLDQQNMAMAQQQAVATNTPAAPMMPTQVPPPEPSEFQNPEPLKAGLQWQVLWVWRDLCLRNGIDTTDEERSAFMAINAVAEAYRLLSAAKTGVMPAEPGAVPAAPGMPAAA